MSFVADFLRKLRPVADFLRKLRPTSPVSMIESPPEPSRRELVVGALSILTAAPVAGKMTSPGSMVPDFPYYAGRDLPPEETVIWSKADECFVWVSKLLGADDREWSVFDVSVTAGVSESDPKVWEKGSRVRFFFAYVSPQGLSLGSILVASSHKSMYAEPKRETYNLTGVKGMDAERRARLYIASPRPFVVHSVGGKFMVKPIVVERYRKSMEGTELANSSMPSSEYYQSFFRSDWVRPISQDLDEIDRILQDDAGPGLIERHGNTLEGEKRGA